MAQTFFPITPTEITPGGANSWQPMDASALIPVGATGVILHVENSSTTKALGLRKNGSADDRHPDMTTCHFWCAIGVDASRIFEAYVETTTFQNIYVVGYTMAGVTFKTNADDMSLGVTGSWQPIDCSVEASGAIGLIWEIHGDGLATAVYGFRKNGSGDDRKENTKRHYTFGAVIGCDSSQICEGYIGSTAIDFYLVGYITDGCTFNLNATDESLGGVGSYIDLGALPAGANMGFIEVAGAVAYQYGLRKNGQSGGYYDIYKDAANHPWAIVECDANRLIEGKIENIGCDFFIVGYSEGPAAAGIGNKSANMGAKMIAEKLI